MSEILATEGFRVGGTDPEVRNHTGSRRTEPDVRRFPTISPSSLVGCSSWCSYAQQQSAVSTPGSTDSSLYRTRGGSLGSRETAPGFWARVLLQLESGRSTQTRRYACRPTRVRSHCRSARDFQFCEAWPDMASNARNASPTADAPGTEQLHDTNTVRNLHRHGARWRRSLRVGYAAIRASSQLRTLCACGWI